MSTRSKRPVPPLVASVDPPGVPPALLDSLHEGDCIPLLADLPAASVSLVFADPPYNLSGKGMQWEGKAMGGSWYKVNESWDIQSREAYAEFTRGWMAGCERVLKPGGALFVSCTYHNLGMLLVTLEALELRCNNIITWYKPNAMPSMTRRTFTHATELVLYFVKGPGWVFNYEAIKALNPDLRQEDGQPRQMRDMWEIPVCQGYERLRGPDRRALHPTQKPEALLERILVAASHPGDLVLDPFMGSGTTAVVARRLGRHYIGFEQNPTYLEAARERLRQQAGGDERS